MRFSKKIQCFYPDDIVYPLLPTDIVEVSQPDFDLAMTRTVGETLDVVNGSIVIVPAPAPTAAQLLADAQTTQLALMDSSYLSAMQQPVAYMGTAFQADANSQSLMSHAIIGLQAIVATGGTVPANFAWYDANNTAVTMTLVQLQGLFATGAANINSLFVHKMAQKSAIRAATSVSAVQAIVF